MKLIAVQPATTTGSMPIVKCATCGRILRNEPVFADLEGVPFKAYYCVTCTNLTALEGVRHDQE
jgi:DNA-directed RNA polymerase subunit RPC12/RpoP